MTTYWDLPDELTGACTFKGLQTFDAGATIASGQTFTLTGATVDGAPTWSSGQTFPSVTAESLDYAGTLLIGTTNATQIDIGHAGITVNLYGAVNNINATDVYVPNDLEVDGVIYADGGIDVTSGLLNLNQSTKVVGNLSVETSLPGISLTDTGANKGLFSSSHALDIQVGVSVSTKKAIVIDVSGNSTILTGTTFTLTGVSVTGGTFASASLTAPILTGTATIASANLSGTLQMGAASTLAFTTGGQISGTIAGTPTWSGAHTHTAEVFANVAGNPNVSMALDSGNGRSGLGWNIEYSSGAGQHVFKTGAGSATAYALIHNSTGGAGDLQLLAASAGTAGGNALDFGTTTPIMSWNTSTITLSQPVTVGSSTAGTPGGNEIIANVADQDVLVIRNYYNTASHSFGVSVAAGTNSSDRCMQWLQNDGATVIGKVDGAGAWTLGPSGFDGQHLVNGELALASKNGFNGPRLTGGVVDSVGNAFWIGPTSALANAKAIAFATNADAASPTEIGSISGAGAWTLGPSAGGVSHTAYTAASGATTVASFNIDTGGAVGNSGGNALYVKDNSATKAGLLAFKHAGITNTTGALVLVTDDIVYNYFWVDNSDQFRISTTASHIGTTSGTVVGTQTSDERLKENISTISYGLSTILALDPIEFDKDGKHHTGFGAQRTQLVLPEAVYDTDIQSFGEGEPTQLGMDYTQIIAPLVKAVQELSVKLDTANARLAALEGGAN